MQNPFKLVLAGVAAMLLLSACGDSSQPQANDSAATSTSSKKLVVGLDDNFPPMGFRDENNELVGFDLDLAREAAKHAGVEIEFKPIDWSAKELELNSKRVDILWNGLTITKEREEKVLFSDPYMNNHQIIIVTTDSPIKTKSDLAEKIVGVQEGSSAVEAVDADAVSKSFKELRKFADNITALMDLSAKRLDAVVVDEVVGRYYVAKKPNDYKVLDDNFGSEEYGVGFRKEDTELRQKFQDALNSMKSDGTSAKIAQKWFGKDTVK